MQKIFSSRFISTVTILFILILFAKLLSLVLWWSLPSEGVELNAKNSYQAKYQRVDFKNMLVHAKVMEAPKKKQLTAYSINSLILKGLYGSRFNGFAIVAKKSSQKKTTIVSVGEIYAGYKLKEIQIQGVIFTKGRKEYLLSLNNNFKKGDKRVISREKQSDFDMISEHKVSKNDIHYYSKNPSKIWKDIAIDPVKRAGKIEGFKVRRIKPHSKMAELGLEKGDIIIRANNIKLSSFRDAIKLYNNIDNIETIELIVLRNNQEKEIIYEIN